MSDPVLVAVIAAAAPTLAIIASLVRTNRKLETIHVLVNSRLTEALREIAALKQEIARLKLGKRQPP